MRSKYPAPTEIKSLAVVLQTASTGGWRYANRLIEGIREVRPALQVTAYLGSKLAKVSEGSDPRCALRELGVEVRGLPYLKAIDSKSQWKRLIGKLRYSLSYPSYRQWQRQLDEHCLAFFAWPFAISCPRISRPLAFIPHDFNYTHYVGLSSGSTRQWRAQRQQHAEWLASASPIVSTHFIADELERNFPSYAGTPHVIPLAQLGRNLPQSDTESRRVVESLGVTGSYILSLNNISSHKNLGQLLGGFHYVQQQRPETKLILVGFGTTGIQGNATTPFYLDRVESNPQVQSLGMRSDREVTALIQQAKLVVNASLYEAGNGSGLDAWALGTPVAMSRIAPFLEHEECLGVRAEKFNPRCCYEIAQALLRILENPSLAAENALQSKLAMQRYTWNDVATRYLDYFDGLVQGSIELEHQSSRLSLGRQAA